MKQYTKYIYLLVYAVALVVFFLLNRYTHIYSDDYLMGYSPSYGGRVDTFVKALVYSKNFYFSWGGSFPIALSQFVFCGIFENKLVFNIVNSFVFGIFILSSLFLVEGRRKSFGGICLFLLLFWFCCPAPNETLFGIVGSTAYLWTCTAAILFLVVYQRFSNDVGSVPRKLLLFVCSLLLASTHILSVASICGAFVVLFLYSLFRNKSSEICWSNFVRTDCASLVCGFFVGAVILIFAPGNFARNAVMYAGFTNTHDLVVYVFNSCLMTFRSYRAVYIFIIVLTFLFVNQRQVAVDFMRKNHFMLIVLAWSCIGYSFIFRAGTRTAMFPEILSVILLCKIIRDYVPKIYRRLLIVIMAVVFCFDYYFAFSNAKQMYARNEAVIQELKENNGIICFETIPNAHRMVNPLRFDTWCYYGLAMKYNLPSVQLMPYNSCDEEKILNICNSDSFHRPDINEYAFVHRELIIDDVEYDYVNLKVPDSLLNSATIHCKIRYTVARKLQRTIREKIGLFRYDRIFDTTLVPVFYRDGYYYYAVPTIETDHGEIITRIDF